MLNGHKRPFRLFIRQRKLWNSASFHRISIEHYFIFMVWWNVWYRHLFTFNFFFFKNERMNRPENVTIQKMLTFSYIVSCFLCCNINLLLLLFGRLVNIFHYHQHSSSSAERRVNNRMRNSISYRIDVVFFFPTFTLQWSFHCTPQFMSYISSMKNEQEHQDELFFSVSLFRTHYSTSYWNSCGKFYTKFILSIKVEFFWGEKP